LTNALPVAVARTRIEIEVLIAWVKPLTVVVENTLSAPPVNCEIRVATDWSVFNRTPTWK
jgi:hypothetical protein